MKKIKDHSKLTTRQVNSSRKPVPARGSKPGERRGGRIKGTPNKVTKDAKIAIAKFVDGNIHRLNKWLDRIAKDNPQAAFNCYMSVVEYHIPKLQRSEQTGKDGGPLTVTILDDVK